MNLQKAKIYHDGSHFIAIPQDAYSSGKGCKRRVVKTTEQQSPTKESPTETLKERFEKAYKESQSLLKRERKAHIKESLAADFANKDELNAFVAKRTERMKTNAIKRKVRLMRKLGLQRWDYFVTFTYSDELHTEETFRKKLTNTLKHLVARNGWKYAGIWERGEDTYRLHFHGIFYIPPDGMVGEIIETKDYNTKDNRMQTASQNTYFLERYGRNDFQKLILPHEVGDSLGYLMKYTEKSGERLVYDGKLTAYF